MGPGRTDLPGYEIDEVLGQGGFATVYRARQLAVGREVALKVDSRVLSTPRDRQRFMREVTAAGQLSGHPHVVPVYDAGVLADNRPYMVLELCPGGSLGDRLHRQGAFPAKEARDIGVGLADAVAAAHSAGVLHRDIKPGNVMVNRYGGVALTDFGLAAMPQPGRELSVTREALTPAYAPPEAFHMADPTPAGDVYSLAATVYALLCGRPPHYPEDGTQLSLAELIVRHTWPYADLPGLPPAFNSALRYALAADPAHRMSEAGAFRDALAAVDLDTVDLRGGGGGAGGGDGFGPAPGMTTMPPYRGAPPTTMPPYGDAPPTTMPPYGAVPPYGGGTTVAPGAGGAGGTTVVPGPGNDGDGGRKGAARRRPAVIAVLAAVAVSVSVSVTVVTYQNGGTDDGDGGGSSTAASPSAGATAEGKGTSGFGAATTTENCPATDVEGVGGRCVATPECWSGIVDISGIVTVSRADCQTKHVWETFAIAPLPEDGMTNNARDLIKHPDVKALCSQKVMAATMTADGRDIADEWNVDIIPPSAAEWDKGLRVFRCVAAAVTDDGEKTGSQFAVRG
ncbi:serine/threonine-protein kinase [Streptomyces europaeiscabiei]|uniref:non-specific serine/threonine protein kinase n=1 Tax=Streptomyces europaeiscabiei TaxID=146819 RepID=A0AAJ2PKX4_9ACTN|nr:serine/threonine-protein kinase [Streptomyces europaeiscabiei]MDX3128957.1 serine/threonine-protein kinase [Streptomyces europaeiscabiei]